MSRIARAVALLALALLTALALAGPASAGKKHGKRAQKAPHAKVLPKGWAKHHNAKGGAKGDPDDDGLTNWGEWRSRTKPHKLDSDRDGIGDAEEDFDGDGLDNGSEEDAGTDPGRRDSDRDGVSDGDEDADRDGVANADEDATGTDPRDADSDDDGTRDGDEVAGVVQSFDGTTLTIALPRGGTVSGVVDADTDVDCSVEADFDDDADAGELRVSARLAEEGDEGDADDEDWADDDEEDCSDALVPGTAVHEAELEDGVFWSVELVR